MSGVDLSGLGAVLVGLAAVIGALASGYMTIKNTKKIRDIDHAVNGKPPGAVTMQRQVADLHSDRPAHIPDELNLNDAAIKQMLQMLVADLYERRASDES